MFCTRQVSSHSAENPSSWNGVLQRKESEPISHRSREISAERLVRTHILTANASLTNASSFQTSSGGSSPSTAAGLGTL